MADYTITATAVLPGTGSTTKHGVSGATIVAGKSIVRDPATGKWVLADSNHATVALRTPQGISLNAASDGQPLAIHTAGPITLGAVLTAGVAVYASDTPGGLCPVADVGSGERSVLIGMPSSTSVLEVDIQDSGVAL
jgi:hypothetical protein